MTEAPRRPEVRIQSENFDVGAELQRVAATSRDIGAVVSFTGLCRDEKGRLSALELEHYAGMAEAQIEKIAATAMRRWPVINLLVIHRYGKIVPGDNIVLVIATSPHRAAAFDAANFVMDFLKTSAPFWKKEHLVDGTTGEWVDAADKDDAALAKWQ